MRDGMPTDGYTCSSCGAPCKTTDNHGEVCPSDPKNKRIADLEADVEYWKQTTVDAQQTADGLRATAELVERAEHALRNGWELCEPAEDDPQFTVFYPCGKPRTCDTLREALEALGEAT